ncbi:MAG: zinc-ribbon domain containing protein [Geodermatophilaceae bacterium]|nr:zinc-ribbon domain containing protein [Geodermatophilaceae bacterium]
MNCLDCGQEFIFTAGEQEFYAQRGFTEAPKRCTSCRAARKAQRNAASGGSAANGYPDSSDSSGGGGYGRAGDTGGGGYSGGGGYGGGYGGERRPPRQLYDAVCADCGKVAQVPFQPTGARPVYCSDCFQSHRG